MKLMLTTTLLLNMVFATMAVAQERTLEEAFLSPSNDAKPIMIWQWMDGLVSLNGITADLEAYREAGIGGVQQFMIGGDMQTLVHNETNAIGSANWQQQVKHAINECARLGLSFGTHNCPGWSSSAYPSVKPEYSMQKIIWSVQKIKFPHVTKKNKQKAIVAHLPQPDIDTTYNFYRDICVIAIPDADSISHEHVVMVTDKMDADGTITLSPEILNTQFSPISSSWRIYRFGHTTNGKTNYATAPMGGVGLECDKMSRQALDHFWAGYPSMMLQLAGEHVGKTFCRFEIDSYEAGGQEWTPLMPEEFMKRKHYDILTWMPAMTGVMIDGAAATRKFKKDWEDVSTSLVAENYYGYMSELTHRHKGMILLAQPYATGGSRPFRLVDTWKVVRRLAADDAICGEFWTKPERWGWPQIPGVINAARGVNHELVFAEGFTCWPLWAWKDDPNDLKFTADRAFANGINSVMLHAGAQNPWPQAKPGMTFGKWGTQWSPNQTWWQSGGAKQLFAYMARCQALLQRGHFIDDFRSKQQHSLYVDQAEAIGNSKSSKQNYSDSILWTHRKDGDADVYFVFNYSKANISAVLSLASAGRMPEMWNPQTTAISEAVAWTTDKERTIVAQDMNAGDAMFIVMRKETTTHGPGLTISHPQTQRTIAVDNQWAVSFPTDWGAPAQITLDSLTAWNESDISGVKYFSGTAKYTTHIRMKKVDNKCHYILDLGDVKNLANVCVNGQESVLLWRPPFRTDITKALRKGDNIIEVSVTNLWPNRMIGDEQEPDDIEWGELQSYSFAKDNPRVGRFMKSVPEWLSKGMPRPSQGRKTVPSFKFFEKDDPLLPSGLLGPVIIEQVK